MALEVDAEVIPVTEFTAARVALGRMNRHVLVESAHTVEDGMADHAHVCIRIGRQARQFYINGWVIHVVLKDSVAQHGPVVIEKVEFQSRRGAMS